MCDVSKILQEALHQFCAEIYQNSPEMPWPPSCEDLNSGAVALPESLTEFLTFLFSGKRPSHATEKTIRLSDSIAQDVCAAVTCGRWKMPKHQLLAMTLKSVTADILTLINRCGYCQSYTSTIDMENALGIEAQEVDTVLPSNISSVANKYIHSCFDNFDMNEGTPSGTGTTHSTHGIVVQEIVVTPDLEVDVDETIPDFLSDVVETAPEASVLQVTNEIGVRHKKFHDEIEGEFRLCYGSLGTNLHVGGFWKHMYV